MAYQPVDVIRSNIPQSVVQAARDQWAAGNYAGAWSTLAQAGDRYADNAAMALGGGNDAAGPFFHDLVQNHWNATVGADVYAQKFNDVARAHLDNYLTELNNGSIPSTQNIIKSYEDALSQNGVDKSAAFDGAWAVAGGGSSWGAMLAMDVSRITTSDSNNGLTPEQAREILATDFAKTLIDVWNRDGIIGLYELRRALLVHGMEAVLDYGLDILKFIGAEALGLLIPSAHGSEINPTTNDWYNFARNWILRKDPLTLDLDGDGLETVGIDPLNPILFDHDGDGIKNATGWIKPDDGFLVLDRNGNGTIDNGTELFGDSTPAYAGGQTADGFAALAQEDSNHDGLVDAKDANWAELRVWQDLNSDGISQEGELKTLEELGIVSFNVAKTENSTRLANGNQIADLGSYVRNDGTQGTVGQITGGMADIDLAANPFYRSFPDTIPLTPQAQSLPDMQGSGMVRDLSEAVSLSPTLGNALANYAAADTKAGQLARVDAVISQWAATSSFQTSIEKAAAQGDRLLFLVPGLTRYDVLGGFGVSNGGSSGTGNAPPSAEQIAQLEALKAQQIRITEILGYLEKFNGLTFVNVEAQGVRTGAHRFAGEGGQYQKQVANDAVFEMRRVG